MFVAAFGRWVNPVALVIAYGVANIAAAIPLTPGGLGVVEATVSGILVGFGTPRTIAIWGVIGWRLVNFWLADPRRGAAYLSLKVHPPADNQAGLAARRACGERPLALGRRPVRPGRSHPDRRRPVPVHEQPRGRRHAAPGPVMSPPC